jgi:ABC-2 type transport system ATP-binding protein
MIRTERLFKSYGQKTALVDLSLAAAPGEILGLLGPNGAGKSTTVRILTGLIPADSGRAIIAGFDIEREPLEAKARLGYVPESPKLFESLTADGFLDLIASLYHLDPATSRARRKDLLALFELADVQHQRLRQFSKGMKQKVVLAAALIHRPDVLILDEPFDGLDANTTLVMKNVLREMAAQGRTILFSSHILDVVALICTRVCIIHHGRQIADGTLDQICRAHRVQTLDEAFARLTSARDSAGVTSDIISAIGGSQP